MEAGWRRLDWRMGGGLEGGCVGIGEFGFGARRRMGIGIGARLDNYPGTPVNFRMGVILYGFLMHLRVARSIGTVKYFGLALESAPSCLGTRDFPFW